MQRMKLIFGKSPEVLTVSLEEEPEPPARVLTKSSRTVSLGSGVTVDCNYNVENPARSYISLNQLTSYSYETQDYKVEDIPNLINQLVDSYNWLMSSSPEGGTVVRKIT